MNEKETKRIPMLDIIVPHYKEPWEVGEKFFAMLNLQRGIDFSSFRVTVVNDGEENALPDEHFQNRPYQVRQIAIPHAGVSAARNAGLKAAEAEWVMFCDFDDMFVNVYAMRDIMNVMPAHGMDMLWTDILIEDKRPGTEVVINEYGQNTILIHGKLYRRSFLNEHQMWFDTDLHYSEDTCFNRILGTILPYERTGKIHTTAPLYVWTDTENSVTRTKGKQFDWADQVFESDRKVCEAFKKNLSYDRYCGMVYRTIADTYYVLNREKIPNELKALKGKTIAFWKEHKKEFDSVPGKTANEILTAVCKNHFHAANKQTCSDKIVSDFTIKNWLIKLSKEGDAP